MKTVDIIKNHIPLIIEHYGLPPITGGKHYKGLSPCCGKKNSFRLDNRTSNGDWICKCSSGNIWGLMELVTGKDFRTLAKEVDHLLGNTYAKTPIAPRRNYQAELFNYWKTLKPIKGTSVERYLQSRGIWRTPTRAMKFVGNDEQGKMFCVATNDRGEPIMKHTTYLHGDAKADINTPKRYNRVDPEKENHDSIAIRLFEPQTCLGIAEGVETALSAHQLFECAVWSTMDSGLMKKFRAPIGVEHLIIFADSDNNGTGMASAFECGRANVLANNDVTRVTIRYPEKGDMNDHLLEAQEINEFKLTK